MVKHNITSRFALLMLVLMLFSNHTVAMLEASLDRSEMAENESVVLTITTDLSLSTSQSLFNLNTLSIPQPDVSVLERDFEILDRQQNYRVQIDNNRNNSVITWTYTLMPKTKGDIIIPAIEYEGEKTTPLTLRVREHINRSTQDKEVFLEAELDLDEVYVQQQLIYRVRLYYSLDLVSGELEQPNHQDAQFSQLGKQKEFSRYVGNKRFQVIERIYTVFPKVAGELVIPEVNFSGTFIKRRIGRRVFFKDATKPVRVTVKPPPASFSGEHWLPAQSLSVRDVWSNQAREIKVGDSLTRTIQLLALGLEGVQLPPLPYANLDGLKVYPEPGKTSTESHAAGVSGTREEVQALVATQPGSYWLPEVRIPWWDVTKDEERVAILQGRNIQVLAGAGFNPSGSSGSVAPLTAPSRAVNANADPAATDLYSTSAGNDGVSGVWKWTTSALLALWLVTLYLWRRHSSQWRERLRQEDDPITTLNNDMARSLEALQTLARTGSRDFVSAFGLWLVKAEHRHWLQQQTLQELKDNVRPLLNQLQQQCYGMGKGQTGREHQSEQRNGLENRNRTEQSPDTSNSGIDGQLARKIMSELEQRLNKQEGLNDKRLRPLYPGAG